VALSRWLYRFNRTPKTPWWSRRETAYSVAGWLGLAAGGGSAVSAAVELEGGWLHFRRRAEAGPVPRYKLYVSPAARALLQVWGTIAAALTGAPVASFKLAATWDGLLRADRIVAHCADLTDLAATADRLAAALAGVPAQGVPFTAEIAGDGLLSWGVDPPAKGQHTWRRWLTDRLAAALLAARAAGEAEPWRFAVERLRLDGVDPEKWTPAADLWPEEPRPSP
jgi:hypothetical protein